MYYEYGRQKFREIKRKQQLASQPVVQPSQTQEFLWASARVSSSASTVTRVSRPDKTKVRAMLQLSPEPVGYLESVAMIERKSL